MEEPQDITLRDALATVIRRCGGCDALPKVEWEQVGENLVLDPPDGSGTYSSRNNVAYVMPTKPASHLISFDGARKAMEEPVAPTRFHSQRKFVGFKQVVGWHYDQPRNVVVIKYVFVTIPFTVWGS